MGVWGRKAENVSVILSEAKNLIVLIETLRGVYTERSECAQGDKKTYRRQRNEHHAPPRQPRPIHQMTERERGKMLREVRDWIERRILFDRFLRGDVRVKFSARVDRPGQIERGDSEPRGDPMNE